MLRVRRSMPSPVEALPCGSRSTISTRSPIGGERGAEIDRRGGLADPALLVGERQDAWVAGRLRRPILLINLINYGHARLAICCRGSGAPPDSVEFDDPAVVRRCGWNGCGRILQYLVASVNSASTSWPLRNSAFAPLCASGSAKPISSCKGASARAVTQSTGPTTLSTISPMSAKCTVPGAEVTRSPRVERRPSWHCARPDGHALPPVSARARARTTPGNPPPLPRSTQILADGARPNSCSQIGDVACPQIRKRRRRNEVCF